MHQCRLHVCNISNGWMRRCAGLQAQLRKRDAEIKDLKEEVKRLKSGGAGTGGGAAAPSMQTGPLLPPDKLDKQVTKVRKQIERGLKGQMTYSYQLKSRPGHMSVEVANVTEQVAKVIMGEAWGPVSNSYVTGQVHFAVPPKPLRYGADLTPSDSFTARWLPFADLLTVSGSYSMVK